MPKEFYNDKILVSSYRDKISICEQRTITSKVYIFRNPELASFARSIGELLWDVLPQPAKSTTEQIFF
jgi:hypothetical protein